MKNLADTSKSNCKIVLKLLVFVIPYILICFMTLIIDPFIYFHKPLDNVSYILDRENQISINEGIIRNIDYDVVMTGASNVENFRTTTCDKIFDCKSVKLALVGAGFKEIDAIVRKAIANKDISLVIRTVDSNFLLYDKDFEEYNSSYIPSYIGTNNVFRYATDSKAQKSMITDVFNTVKGEKIVIFDEYSNQTKLGFIFSRKSALENYTTLYSQYIGINDVEQIAINEEIYNRVSDSINANLLDIARDNPDVTFCYFFTPYNVLNWNTYFGKGEGELIIQAQKIAIEAMLEVPNIKIYSWDNNYELTTNLEVYRDKDHYNEDTTDNILEWISEDKGLLTKSNYLNYIEDITEFYSTYDYNSLFE